MSGCAAFCNQGVRHRRRSTSGSLVPAMDDQLMARVEAARSRATLQLKIFSILLNRFGLLIHRRSVRWLSLGNMCALWGGDAAFGGNAAFGDNAALHAVWVFNCWGLCPRLALDHASGTAHHGVVSKTQATALRAAVIQATSAGMSAEVGAQAVIAVTRIQWHLTAHCDFAIGPLDTIVATMKRRRSVQDWLALPTYFTASMWAFLADTKQSSPAKLDLILAFGNRGGLRLPSEATSKLMTSIWLIVSEPHLDSVAADQKLVYLRHAKQCFNNLRRRATDPDTWVETLPASPFAFQTSYPTAWSTWFTNGEMPGIMPAGFLATLQSFDSTYGCRTSKSAPQLASAATPMNVMEKFMSMMMVNQHKMLEMSFHGGTSMGGLPSCLNPSAGSGGLSRELSLEWLPSPRGLQPTRFPAALPSAPPPPTPPPLASGQELATLPAPLADDSQSIVTTPVPRCSALDDVGKFLDLVSARKEAAAKAKKLKKPKAMGKASKKDKASTPEKKDSKDNAEDVDKDAETDDYEEAVMEVPKIKVKAKAKVGENASKRKNASPPSKKASDEKKTKMTASKASKRKDKKRRKTRGLAKIIAVVKASNAKKVPDAMDEDVEDEAEGSAKTGSAKTVSRTKGAAKDKAPSSAAVSATKGAAEDNVASRAAVSATNGAAKKDVASKAAGKGNKVYERGCAKCRWKSGCARCLAPDYKGVRFSMYD